MNSDVNIRFLLLKDFSSFIVQIILFFFKPPMLFLFLADLVYDVTLQVIQTSILQYCLCTCLSCH